MLKRQLAMRFQNGTIQFRVLPAFAERIIPEQYIQVPYKVVYADRDLDPVHIFNCEFNMLKSLISVVHLELQKPPSEEFFTSQEIRYLLGRTVDAAETLAKFLKKDKVIVSSRIEAIIDVFVEKDFIYGKKSSIVGYKGVKRNLR
jgi:hypothetical protein